MIVPSSVAVRYALGVPLRPLVVTNIYNDPVLGGIRNKAKFVRLGFVV
jgi:hypothetical protein